MAQIENPPKKVQPSVSTSSTTASNLELIVEGPFAIDTQPGQPGKIKILIPKASDHFDPGFDADLNDQIVCPGDFSIDFPGHSAPQVLPNYDETYLHLDKVAVKDVSKPYHYNTSILLDIPDRIALLGPSHATIQHNQDIDTYASKLVLRYENMKPDEVTVRMLTGDSCVVNVNDFYDLPIPHKTVVYTFPYQPKFAPLGNDARLVLSMQPSVKDDALHRRAQKAYDSIAKMLGIKRDIIFFPVGQIVTDSANGFRFMNGAHHNCRAPLILVSQ